jgi:hypothetical protein
MLRKKRAAPPPSAADLIDEPMRLEAVWREVRRPLAWMALAFGALGAVVAAGLSRPGGERLAEFPGEVAALVGPRGAPAGPVIARVGEEVERLREEARRTEAQRLALEQRLALIERGLGDVTGSIRARETPPAGPPPRVAPDIAERPPAERTAEPPPAAALDRPAPEGAVTLAGRTQFAIDLGAEPTLSALRARWQRLAQRHPGLLGPLEPLAGIREAQNGQPVLHLVAGPFADAAEAAALCARLRTAGAPACRPASFDGQRLAQP